MPGGHAPAEAQQGYYYMLPRAAAGAYRVVVVLLSM